MSKVRETWADEDGRTVRFHSFFSTLYEDEESRRLSRKYNMYDYHGNFVPSSLGEAHDEKVINQLLSVCKVAGQIVGFEKKELEAFDSFSQGRMLESGYLRLKKVRGIEVLFPTEQLLKNQKVKQSSEK